MAHTEQDYRDAASALPSKYLGSRFGYSGLDEAGVSAIHRIALFKDNAELMGLQGGSVESVQKRGLALSGAISRAQEANARRAKTATEDAAFLDLLSRYNDLKQELADIRGKIATLDEELRAEYGDDYLDDMAKMYLSESELEPLGGLDPVEREERIKALLSDKMLNDDGSIKDAYKGTKIARFLEQMKKEAAIQERINKLKKAHESGDPEAARNALGNDELTDDADQNARKQQTGLSLKETYGVAANAETDAAAAAIESQDVAQNADPNSVFSDFDNFSNS